MEPDPDFPTVKYPNPEEGKSALVCLLTIIFPFSSTTLPFLLHYHHHLILLHLPSLHPNRQFFIPPHLPPLNPTHLLPSHLVPPTTNYPPTYSHKTTFTPFFFSPQNLAIETANTHNSTLILANDPDADRLAVAEKQSRFVLSFFFHSYVFYY